jgi:hypothetical protein
MSVLVDGDIVIFEQLVKGSELHNKRGEQKYTLH